MKINIGNIEKIVLTPTGDIIYPRFICSEFRVPTYFNRDLQFISDEIEYIN